MTEQSLSNLIIGQDGLIHLPVDGKMVAFSPDDATRVLATLPVALDLRQSLVVPVEQISKSSIIASVYDDMLPGTPLEDGFFTCLHPLTRRPIITCPKRLESGQMSWQASADHCAGLGGGWARPSRLIAFLQDQFLSQRNAVAAAFKAGGAEAFEEGAHWTDEKYQFNPDYAWGQYFGNGRADAWGKYRGLRVRAARIL